ncbi:MAG: sulfatase-like hydrolase/transferase [Akkermansiaceae bacterium]|nr:sulfatase-like hydrolase/transferase [Akkermansiaceae bacterium]
MPGEITIISFLSGLLFGPATVQAGAVSYGFNDATKINGSGAAIVYTAPDTNTLGAGLTFSDFELTDNASADHYGRIVSSINGTALGSSKAAVTSRGTAPGGNAMHFTVNVPAGRTLDLNSISFDYGFYSSLSTAADNAWVLSITVGGVTTEVGTGGFTHDGGTDYQEPASAAGNVDLSNFTGLTNTTVTFHWQCNSTATHTFTSRAHTIDNIQVTGALEVIAGFPSIVSFSVDDRAVPPNTPVVLSWDTTDADTVTLSTVGSVAASGSANAQPAVTTTYTLIASNEVGTVQTDLKVTMLPDKPNILLMLVDDWGVTDLSVPFAYSVYDDTGTPLITNLNILHKTPNLETLASQGMKFTQAYATPKCSSSRASILTGLHPARHGITYHLAFDGDIGTGPNNWRHKGFDASDVTLAHMLAPEGYRAIHCGKWHLGGIGDYAQFPTAVGFDINIAGSNSGQPARYVANASDGYEGTNRAMPNMDHYKGTGMYLTRALTIELNKAMGNAVGAGEPFFAYMSYYGVHDPETTNPDATGDYSDAFNADHKKFCTMVEAIDVSLGDVIRHLEELGIAEETLIIHLGDNGSENPVHRTTQGQLPAAPFNDFPMRGMKNDGTYQGGCRVPLMISWAKPTTNHPMQQSHPITSGGVEHDIVGIEDIAPTFCRSLT